MGMMGNLSDTGEFYVERTTRLIMTEAELAKRVVDCSLCPEKTEPL